MGREIRMVKPGWEHPQEPGRYSDGSQRYVPLLDSNYADAKREYDYELAKWNEGLKLNWATGQYEPLGADYADVSFEDYHGTEPQPENYMPVWEPGEATLMVMYETCTEGTPISPGFETPEELARWLADNGASSFGSSTATYEQWLATCKAGWAVSAVIIGNHMMSGVEANTILGDDPDYERRKAMGLDSKE